MTLRGKLLYDRDHRRRYASRFQLVIGPDHAEAKRTREKFVVAYWIASRFRKECPYVPLIELCDPPEPDCKLTDKQGRKTGVEVTELVDQAMVERVARARAPSYAKEWTHDEVFEAVVKILEKKECGLAHLAGQYEKMILIIHTGESLTPDFCRAAFVGRTFPKLQSIHEAFLLLKEIRTTHANDREAWFCPIVQTPI